MRASDADRDRAASVLGEALAEGRLTAQEHSQRLDLLYAAKTHADIAPLVQDLPGASAALAAQPAGQPAPARYEDGTPVRPRTSLISIFSGHTRKGVWHAPPEIDAINVFGGTDIDLREAVLPGREIKIRAICVFGGMSVVVPPEMRIVDSGFSLFGGRDVSSESDESGRPDAPVLHLTAICVFGGMDVKRKRRKSSGTSGRRRN